MDVLEKLYLARATLQDEAFDFGYWDRCTCGHIYAAATGDRLDRMVFWCRDTDPRGLAVMEATARALGWTDASALSAFGYVNQATKRVAREDEDALEVTREHALAVVDRAIATLEAQQRADRLAVLAQAERIVDAAPAAEETLA